MNSIVELVVLSLAVATTSLTVTRARIFKRLREAIKTRSEWFGELVSCPYCFSHWVAIVAVAVVQPTLTSSWHPVDLLISVLAVVALASMGCGLIFTAINATAVRGEK